MDTGHWTFYAEFDPDEWFGFIYRITNLATKQEYIGKKQFRSTTRLKPLKGKTRKRKKVTDSNWKEYTGSSTHLNAAIEEAGMDNFKFEIVSLHETKGSLYYAEVYVQITEDVMRATFDDGMPKYYNKQVGAVKFKVNPPTLKESKMNSLSRTS
jgi:hypothetical protein